MGKSWASCLCERPPMSQVWPPRSCCGPLIQLWSQTTAKEALFFDPDCDRPPVYSCCLWSNCPGLNLNSFSISAQFCFLKINHWESLSLGRRRDPALNECCQESLPVGSKMWRGAAESPKKAHHPFSLLFPIGAYWGYFFFGPKLLSPLCLCTGMPGYTFPTWALGKTTASEKPRGSPDSKSKGAGFFSEGRAGLSKITGQRN